MELSFEWDEAKDAHNAQKHGVAFLEGRTIFFDPFAVTFPDPDHSERELRSVSIGCSSKGRVLVVVHTERGDNVRIISCRKATLRERRAYAEGDY